MYNTVVRMAPSDTDAEDIVQEAFIKVFQNLSQFKGDSTLGAWIKRIVINTALNFLRRHKRINYLNTEIEDTLAQPLEADVQETDIHRIHQAIKTLPEGCRLVFNLYLLEGYQHKEIAQILGISESTSKSQYQRARRLLQRQLKGAMTG
jgi:RNA polymerase sigma-70 factor (ECF subfamily)